MADEKLTKNQRRDQAREQARLAREEEKKREKRNRLLLQGGIVLGVVAILAVVALVAVNGFFVATEFSLVSVRRSRIESLVAEGNTRARPVLDALRDLDGFIAATQLGITIASIGLGWVGEPALADLFDPLLSVVLPASVAAAAFW